MISVRPIRVESNSKMIKEHCKWLRGEHGTPKCSLHLFPCRNFIFHPILRDYGLPYENASEINPPLINSTAVILNRKPAFTTGWNIMKESHLEGKSVSAVADRRYRQVMRNSMPLTGCLPGLPITKLLQIWSSGMIFSLGPIPGLRRATGLGREN